MNVKDLAQCLACIKHSSHIIYYYEWQELVRKISKLLLFYGTESLGSVFCND